MLAHTFRLSKRHPKKVPNRKAARASHRPQLLWVTSGHFALQERCLLLPPTANFPLIYVSASSPARQARTADIDQTEPAGGFEFLEHLGHARPDPRNRAKARCRPAGSAAWRFPNPSWRSRRRASRRQKRALPIPHAPTSRRSRNRRASARRAGPKPATHQCRCARGAGLRRNFSRTARSPARSADRAADRGSQWSRRKTCVTCGEATARQAKQVDRLTAYGRRRCVRALPVNPRAFRPARIPARPAWRGRRSRPPP